MTRAESVCSCFYPFFTSIPTSIFIGRDGKVKQVHAGFRGPATGPQHEAREHDVERTIERLLAE